MSEQARGAQPRLGEEMTFPRGAVIRELFETHAVIITALDLTENFSLQQMAYNSRLDKLRRDSF